MIYDKLKDLTKEQLIDYLRSGLSREQIAEKFNVGSWMIYKKAKEFNIDIRSTKKEYNKNFNVHVFDEINTEEKAYWLGFLYADGCVYNTKPPLGRQYKVSLALKSEDIDHIRKFKRFLEDVRDDSAIKINTTELNGKKFDEAKYVVCSSYFVDKLTLYGCVPRKSLILKFPDKSIFKEDKLIIDFIRGYIDGDGSLSCARNRLQISVLGTFDFLNGIKQIFPEFSSITSKDSVYNISCQYNKADLVAHKLYGNATVYLDRKYNKYATLCKLYTGEKSGNIGEGCDANTEITPEITKGSEES